MEQRQQTDKMAAWTVVAVGIFAIGFFVIQSTGILKWDKEKGALLANLKGSSIKQTQIPSVDPTLDTDGEGIPDVQELRIGTDPRKADTDNDGYTDKQEIDTGHDPLVNAKKASEVEAKGKETLMVKTTSGSTLTLDGKENALPGSASVPAADSLKSADSLGNLALLGTTINNGNATLPEISEKEIIVSQNDGRSAIQGYLASLVGLFIKHSPWSGTDDFQSAFSAVRMGSLSEIKKANEAQAIAYENLKLIPVPPTLVDTHKKILSTMRLTMNGMALLTDAMESPNSTSGLDATSKLQVALSAWNDVGTTLQNLVIQYQVTLPL